MSSCILPFMASSAVFFCSFFNSIILFLFSRILIEACSRPSSNFRVSSKCWLTSSSAVIFSFRLMFNLLTLFFNSVSTSVSSTLVVLAFAAASAAAFAAVSAAAFAAVSAAAFAASAAAFAAVLAAAFAGAASCVRGIELNGAPIAGPAAAAAASSAALADMSLAFACAAILSSLMRFADSSELVAVVKSVFVSLKWSIACLFSDSRPFFCWLSACCLSWSTFISTFICINLSSVSGVVDSFCNSTIFFSSNTI